MVPNYQVIYYASSAKQNPVSNFLDSLSAKQQSKIIRVLNYIREYGLESVALHTRKISGSPLWEIRILGSDNIRVIYAIPIRNIVLLLHGFIKKSQKTPHKELNKALERLKEYQNRP